MTHKLQLLCKVFLTLLYFKFLLASRSFQDCLIQCQKKGSLKTTDDIRLVDKILRWILNTFQIKQACLLHTLVLTRLVESKIKIYLEIENTDSFQSHAFVKWNHNYYSTSRLKNPDEALHLWSKEC